MSAVERDFDVLWNYDDPAGTEQRFRAQLPGARASGGDTYLAELLTQIARTQALQRRFDDAHSTLDAVESLLVGADAQAEVRYQLERGRVLNSSGHPGEARWHFLEAWELARRGGLDPYAVDAAHMVAIVVPPESALDWNLRALELADRSEDPGARRWRGSLHNNVGWTHHDLGRYEEALAAFERGLEAQRERGDGRNERIAAWTVARALRSLGRYEEALASQEENQRRALDAGDSDGYIEEEIGECLLALGRAAEAAPHFAQAYAMLSQDPWLSESDPERLERLQRLGGT